MTHRLAIVLTLQTVDRQTQHCSLSAIVSLSMAAILTRSTITSPVVTLQVSLNEALFSASGLPRELRGFEPPSWRVKMYMHYRYYSWPY